MTVCQLCLHLLQLWPQGGVLIFELLSFLTALIPKGQENCQRQPYLQVEFKPGKRI